MMVTDVHIYNCEEDKVEEDSDLFNQHYKQYTDSLKVVTGSIYQPGQQPDITKPVLRVKPSFRGSTSGTSSNNLRLRTFLQDNNIMDLEEHLTRSGITVEDILEMDNDEMTETGIQAYRHRKKLLRAIRELAESSTDTVQDAETQPREMAPRPSRPVEDLSSPCSSTPASSRGSR